MLNRIKSFIRKDKRILLSALAFGVLFSLGYAAYAGAGYSDTMQQGIADSVIRLHIRANSDSEADQNLKLLVRDALLANMSCYLNGTESKDEARVILLSHMNELADTAKEVIAQNGAEYAVSAYLTYDVFPARSYGGVSLPAGQYEALRVEIGEAKGRNWWCVMFPPLCFVDITQGEITESDVEELKNVLTAEQFDLITGDGISVKLKFKVVDLWQSLKG